MTVEMLKVVNHNPFILRGRYDGKDYEFPPDEPVTLPFAAAAHIFDIGKEDKSQALNMLGLLIPGRDTYDDAIKKIDQVSFHEGRMTFDDDELDQSDMGEIHEEDKKAATRGRRTGSGARPPQSQAPGGEQAAGGKPSAAANP